MTDDPVRRRRSDSSLDHRVTVLEVEMRNHVRTSEQLHLEQTALIKKLDERADQQDVQMARLLAVVSVVIFLAQLFAPVIRQFLFGQGTP